MALAPNELTLILEALKRYSRHLESQMKAPSARGHYKRIADIDALADKVQQHYQKLIT